MPSRRSTAAFELAAIQVYDYHTFSLAVPPGLLKNAVEGTPNKDQKLQINSKPVLLQVKIRCDSPSQFIGVAALDLFFLESEGQFRSQLLQGVDRAMVLSLHCHHAGVASSTYFAGVISFLFAAVMYIAGYFQSYISSVAGGSSVGGGPLEAFTRLVKGTTVAGQTRQDAICPGPVACG